MQSYDSYCFVPGCKICFDQGGRGSLRVQPTPVPTAQQRKERKQYRNSLGYSKDTTFYRLSEDLLKTESDSLCLVEYYSQPRTVEGILDPTAAQKSWELHAAKRAKYEARLARQELKDRIDEVYEGENDITDWDLWADLCQEYRDKYGEEPSEAALSHSKGMRNPDPWVLLRDAILVLTGASIVVYHVFVAALAPAAFMLAAALLAFPVLFSGRL